MHEPCEGCTRNMPVCWTWEEMSCVVGRAGLNVDKLFHGLKSQDKTPIYSAKGQLGHVRLVWNLGRKKEDQLQPGAENLEVNAVDLASSI